MPYIIANDPFRTKNDVTARCRAILAATPDGCYVDADSIPFLLELFQFHDEWGQKAAGGVANVSAQTTEHGTRCFVLIKRAGGSVDISFAHAVRLIPTSRSANLLPQALRDFRSAARVAVKAQIFEFRDSALKDQQQCPVTGDLLTRDTCAVDHVPPKTFDRLLYDFCC